MNPTPRQLSAQIENLRQRSAAAGSVEELENCLDEARLLLKQAFQTDAEETVRTLFRQLLDHKESIALTARPAQAAAPADRREQLARRLRQERLRLSSSATLDDVDLAVDGLHRMLRELEPGPQDASLRQEALAALETVAGLNTQLRRKVVELLESPDLAGHPEVAAALARLKPQASSGQRPASAPHPAPSGASAAPAAENLPPADISGKLAAARRLFYAGDYFEAVDALTEILQLDPDNREARERLAQVEDNLKRGIVPDSRVPFEARAAYGRAQSLERASRFEEAREAYRQALIEARAGGPLLQNWQPAVEALLRIDNSIIAHDTRDEADELLRAGKWREATDRYEVVLKLLPDDSQSRERARLLRTLLEQVDALQAQFGAPTEDMAGVSQALARLRRTLREMRSILADVPRYKELEAEAEAGAQTIRNQIVGRSQELLAQARFLPNVGECSRMLEEAAGLLALALQVAPDDRQVAELRQSAISERARLKQAAEELEQARHLAHLDTDSAREQALGLLRKIREYDQDPAYLLLLSQVQRQYLDLARAALQDKQLTQAREMLARAREDPFTLLGQTEEVWQLDQALVAARRQPWLRALAWGGGAAALLLILALLARPLGVFGSTPAPTPVPSRTALPSATPPPTATAYLNNIPLLAPDTATSPSRPTKTPTPEPSPTPTLSLPTVTPTPAPRYGAISQDSAARLSPEPGAPWAFTLRLADPVQVLDEKRDSEGHLWYKIRYVRGESVLVGWAHDTDVNVQPPVTP